MSYDYWVVRPKNLGREIEKIAGESDLLPIGNTTYIKISISKIFPGIGWKREESSRGVVLWGDMPPSCPYLSVLFEDNCEGVLQVHVLTSSRRDTTYDVRKIAKALRASMVDMQTWQVWHSPNGVDNSA